MQITAARLTLLCFAVGCLFAASLGCGGCDEGVAGESCRSDGDCLGACEAGVCVDEPGTNNGTNNTGTNNTGTNNTGTNNTGTNNGTNGTNNGTNGTNNNFDCGIYSSMCDGECIPTSSDPDNCGGCGIVCTAAEVCSGGQCVSDCLAGLDACDRRCVDLNLDGDHCGECGIACNDGEGCVDTECVPSVDLDFDAAACDGGGPPIDLGGAVEDSQSCAGDLAELTFRWGICSCEDFRINNDLLVDAYDSRLGPYQPGGFGGGVGVNEQFSAQNDVSISGTFWVASPDTLTLDGRTSVAMQLWSGGTIASNEEGSVGRDAYVRGDFLANATFDIARTLYMLPGATPGNEVTYGDLQNVDFDVGLPCTGGCPPDEQIDVAGIVAAFSGNNNDNAVIGLDPDVINPPNPDEPTDEPTRIDLPCGRYYLSGINSGEPVTIVAHGNTALFIDGDVTSNNPLTLSLTPDAQFDVFVAGDVTTNNPLTLGSPNYPALMRLYVGGDGGFTTNNAVRLGGFIYAVPGGVNTNNEVEIFGGVYTQNAVVNNEWYIHYDRRVTTVGDHCPGPDPDPNNNPNGDPNNNPNNNPNNDPDPDPAPCKTEGDACVDGECCTPLMCTDGTCSLLDCVPSFGACTSSDQCCNGVCSASEDGICVVQ